MIDHTALKLAYSRVLLPGLKPEDYYRVGEDLPIQVAAMVVGEYRHILTMRRLRAEHRLYRSRSWVRRICDAIRAD